MKTTTNETTIEIDDKVPVVRIIREFDHPVSKVFRAHADADLFAKWCGPRDLERRATRSSTSSSTVKSESTPTLNHRPRALARLRRPHLSKRCLTTSSPRSRVLVHPRARHLGREPAIFGQPI